ncbi:MAG: hypothetical protein K2K90_08395 [Lachnospiraceae bacterium]|nr:hypothetical protein [Lachnospiraceae bacterium]
MKKKILLIMAVLTMTVSTCMVAIAAENPSSARAGIRSEGVIRYSGGERDVVIDAADFYTLADQLDLFKVRAVKQLGVMRTYLTHSGGGVAMTSADGIYAVHKKPRAGEEADPLSLDFATILEGIAVSQSIPSEPEAFGFPTGTKLYKKADGTLSTSDADGAEPISIQPAAAGNLSAGTAAWVNGELLLGTGGDMSEMLKEISNSMGSIDSATGHSISSEYTLPEDVPLAIAYVSTDTHTKSGPSTAKDPTFTVNGGGKYIELIKKGYSKGGYDVRIRVYLIRNLPAGTVIKGSNGLLFY